MMKFKQLVRNILGTLVGIAIVMTGVYHRAKKQAKTGHKITPLCFHTIDQKFFRKCLAWLENNGYEFISTRQLIQFLTAGATLPGNPVWITFDDGWQENIEHVIPVIIEKKIPVTFFISTGPVEEGGNFWWSYILKYGKYLPPDANTIKKMRRIKEPRRKALIKALEQKISDPIDREAMTIAEVARIAKLPGVTIGNHTVNHVIMPNCTDQELEFEIREANEKLEKWTGKKVTFFSYPEGIYNDHSKEMIGKFGFELGVTMDNRFVTRDDDPYFVPRFWVRGEGSMLEAKCQMLGIWNPFIQKILKLLGRSDGKGIYS